MLVTQFIQFLTNSIFQVFNYRRAEKSDKKDGLFYLQQLAIAQGKSISETFHIDRRHNPEETAYRVIMATQTIDECIVKHKMLDEREHILKIFWLQLLPMIRLYLKSNTHSDRIKTELTDIQNTFRQFFESY